MLGILTFHCYQFMYLLCMVVTHQGAATWLESQFPQLSAVLHYSAALHCYFTVKAMYLV